ncbi:hypothetical protein Tco_0180490 [Tanacetum coccineum]
MNKVANNQTFEELLKAIKEVTLMVRNLSVTVDGSLQVMKEPVTEAPCYDDLGRLYSTKSGVASEKKKVVKETTFHESNKLDLGLGSGAYGKDANYHEFMDDSVMEEIYIASPVMVMAEDLGQKRLRHCAANRKRKKRKGPFVWTKSKSRVVIEVGQTEAIEGGLNCDNRSANYEQPCQHLLMFDYDPQEGELQVKTWDPGITWLKILKEHLEDKVFLRSGVMIRSWNINYGIDMK